MRNQFLRRRLTAIALVVVSIGLLTGYFGEPLSGPLHSIQRGFAETISPLQKLAGAALRPFRDGYNWIGDSLTAKSENAQLRKDLQDLRFRIGRLETSDAENEQLRALLDFSQSKGFPSGYRAIGAGLVVRSPQAWSKTIVVDRGSSDGVTLDAPVLGAGGLIGKVSNVSANLSQVTLITDTASSVSAALPSRRILGLARSSGAAGSSDQMVLDFVPEQGRIRPRDIVVTSGNVNSPEQIESIFPAGIPIGVVTKVDPTERKLYKRVQMKPLVNIRNLRVVQILVKGAS